MARQQAEYRERVEREEREREDEKDRAELAELNRNMPAIHRIFFVDHVSDEPFVPPESDFDLEAAIAQFHGRPMKMGRATSPRERRSRAERRACALAMYEAGNSMSGIAAALSASYGIANRWVTGSGIQKRPSGFQPK